MICLNVLFLSTATGQGHNAASLAVKEYLDGLGCRTVMLDVLRSGKRDASRFASRLYEGIVVHAPWFFGCLFSVGACISGRFRSPIYYLNGLYADRLWHKIEALQPDVIVTSHIFSAQALTRIRERRDLGRPVVAIMTDYNFSPFWNEVAMDRYVVPSPALREEFIRRGVPAEKIIPVGIPVSGRFRRRLPREEARRAFGLPDGRVYALLGGSMGYGDYRRLAAALRDADPGCQVAAVCGHNKRLRRSLCGLPGVTALGYIDNVDVLMDAADVVLTKPGGLSSTEAMVKGMPLVLTKPIPGCEELNFTYLTALGVAAPGRTAAQAAQAALGLTQDTAAAARMRRAQQQHIRRETTCEIGDMVLALGQGPRAAVAER